MSLLPELRENSDATINVNGCVYYCESSFYSDFFFMTAQIISPKPHLNAMNCWEPYRNRRCLTKDLQKVLKLRRDEGLTAPNA